MKTKTPNPPKTSVNPSNQPNATKVRQNTRNNQMKIDYKRLISGISCVLILGICQMRADERSELQSQMDAYAAAAASFNANCGSVVVGSTHEAQCAREQARLAAWKARLEAAIAAYNARH
jgi:hypothetical protein